MASRLRYDKCHDGGFTVADRDRQCRGYDTAMVERRREGGEVEAKAWHFCLRPSRAHFMSPSWSCLVLYEREIKSLSASITAHLIGSSTQRPSSLYGTNQFQPLDYYEPASSPKTSDEKYERLKAYFSLSHCGRILHTKLSTDSLGSCGSNGSSISHSRCASPRR